jgi:glutamyl-tRNA synthetase
MTASSRPVRTRFAPSPTGYLHIGGLRTALYAWFMARRHNGAFLLRIEDTDRKRYVEGAIESMCAIFEKLHLTPDEGVCLDAEGHLANKGPHAPYLQSERREKHLQYAYELIKRDRAYYCFCSAERLEELSKEQALLKQAPMYDRRCRALAPEAAENRAAAGEPHVIRLKVPTEGSIVMEDLIRGSIEIPWAQVDDAVLIKTDGYPTYHLAATCDDHDMEISHVIRGEEWIASLPKHIFLAQSMGWEVPQYAHLPLLLNPDRSKLSKRQGDVAVEDYLAKGYLPEALLNFVALLGWNPTSDREIFTKEELASVFDLAKVNKSGAIFNTEKLNWLNNHYLKAFSVEAYLAHVKPWITSLETWGPTEDQAAFLDRLALISRERVDVASQLPTLMQPLLVEHPVFEADLLQWKAQTKAEAQERLQAVRDLITPWTETHFASSTVIEMAVRALIVERGWANGDTLWPLRVALSGAKQSPSPFELLFAFGKTRSLQRIDEALARLA